MFFSSMPTLAENAELLRVQLGFAEGLTVAEIVSRASDELGLSHELKGLTLIQKCEACLSTLGASPVPTAMLPVAAAIPITAVATGVPTALEMQRESMPLPPSGKWAGTFTSRLVGTGQETQYYQFHADGRMTGRIENQYVKCAINGTFNLATGAFSYTEMGGDRATVNGTITGNVINAHFQTHRDSGPQSSSFVAALPTVPLEQLTSTQAAAGCYIGCAPPFPFPVIASVTAQDENTLKECAWCFPTPIIFPQTWVRDGPATNWFTEQGDTSLQKELVSANYHRENKGYFTCCKIG